MTMDHRSSSRSSATSVAARLLSLGLAGGLALLPMPGWAAPDAGAAEDTTAAPAPEGEAPAPETAPAETAPAETAPAETAPAETAPAETAPAEPATEPEPAPEAQPEPEPEPEAQPEPEPEPKPVVSKPEPAPAEELAGDEPPADPAKARRLRRGGAGTMIAGGTLALSGLALTIAFTALGTQKEEDLLGIEEALALEDCSMNTSSGCDIIRADLAEAEDGITKADTNARIGGALLLTGALAVVVGGVVYRKGVRMGERARAARIRVSPSIGGAVISGRF